MAFIKSPDSQFIYLSEHHTFGRLEEKVDFAVNDRSISRIHAVVHWHESQWVMRDLSTNGTWVNGKRVKQNTKIPLSKQDRIQLGNSSALPFEFLDDSPPKDALVQHEYQGMLQPEVVYLENYHFLPEDTSPEVVLYKKNNLWYADNLTDIRSSSEFIADKARLNFDNKQWQLRLVQESNATLEMDSHDNSLCRSFINLLISQDEEHCQVEVLQKTVPQTQRAINLGRYSHHLVTLMLARYRAQDMQTNLAQEEQGWAYVDQISRDIGLEERHINIQIHRIRKQIAEHFPEHSPLLGLIERRRGQVRFNFPEFQILKAGKTEFSTRENNN